MTLIDLLKPWFLARWDVSFSKNPGLDEYIVRSRTSWLARVYSDKVDVRITTNRNNCICCAKRSTLNAYDPEFFSQLEAAINCCINDEKVS